MYRLSLDPVVEDQIKAIPAEALRPLAELFTLLETAPWSGQPFSPANPRGNMLTHASDLADTEKRLCARREH